nr:MAG TPA: hypothetical protein [Caudoviricetes sp.]
MLENPYFLFLYLLLNMTLKHRHLIQSYIFRSTSKNRFVKRYGLLNLFLPKFPTYVSFVPVKLYATQDPLF